MGSTTTLTPAKRAPRPRPVLQPDWRPGQPIDRTGCPGRGKHGTVSAAMKRGCICADAREKHRIYKKRQREGRLHPGFVHPVGTQRRIRALQARGWPLATLAARLGCTKQHIAWLATAHDRGEMVHARNAHRVAVLYLDLQHRPGPSTSAAKRAAARGWATPDQWLPGEIDDPDALSDLDHQRTPSSTPAAGAEYLEKLDLGLTLEDIAADHGISVDSVKVAIARERRRRQTDQIRKVSRVTVSQLEYARDRIAQGASYSAAAAELGISRSNLSNLLAGRVSPAPDGGLATPGPGRTTTRPPTAPQERKSA